MQKTMGKSKKAALAVIALLLLAALFAALYLQMKPQAMEGEKSIRVEVVNLAGEQKVFEFHTNAAYLREALEEQNLIEGDSGPYGLYVTIVDGVAANDAKKEWWRFSRSGEALTASVDATPICDGDRYEIALVAGY